jgi:hypothetical protein
MRFLLIGRIRPLAELIDGFEQCYDENLQRDNISSAAGKQQVNARLLPGKNQDSTKIILDSFLRGGTPC